MMSSAINIIDLLINSFVFMLGIAFGYCVGWLDRLNAAARADDTLNHLIRRNRR